MLLLCLRETRGNSLQVEQFKTRTTQRGTRRGIVFAGQKRAREILFADQTHFSFSDLIGFIWFICRWQQKVGRPLILLGTNIRKGIEKRGEIKVLVI